MVSPASDASTTEPLAAGRAAAYRVGGRVDWYLPSRDEVNAPLRQADAVGGISDQAHPLTSAIVPSGCSSDRLGRSDHVGA